MGISEPFQTADGDLWHFNFDETTQLHTLTIKTPEGVVKSRTTMTSEQLRELAGALSEMYAMAMEIRYGNVDWPRQHHR